MADQRGSATSPNGAPEIGAALADIAERSGRIVREFLEREALNGHDRNADPLDLGRAFFALTSRMMADPFKLAEAQLNLWQGYMELWASSTRRLLGQETPPVAAPEPGDRRFRDPAWEENQVFDFIKQSYLLTSRFFVPLLPVQRDLAAFPGRIDRGAGEEMHPDSRQKFAVVGAALFPDTVKLGHAIRRAQVFLAQENVDEAA